MNPLLLFRTLRHLRWTQLLARPLRVGQFKLYRHSPHLAFRPTAAGADVSSVSPRTIETIRKTFSEQFAHLNTPLAEFDETLSGLKQNRFTFLNRSLTIQATVDWNHRYESHLWNYQLHYFSFAPLTARAWVERGDDSAWRSCRELIQNWIVVAEPGRSDGWDEYPISLRVVNWIYAYALVAEREDEAFLAYWRASIFDQLGFLRGHLEHHLLANHLLKNIKALIVGGLFFQNEKWLDAGKLMLWREFREQVLPDGGHYERSPMYHAQVLTDFLESYALLVVFRHLERYDKVDAQLQAMADFLSAMSYADGSLALFNDSANTVETRPQPILESARRIVGSAPQTATSGNLSFPQTGYYLWVSADGREKIIVDAGEPSVAYNTAHAHCDLLSFELRLNGQPFIVDSGVHGYGGDRFREYCRSTRAHNTVMFDGGEQSEVWSTFRMARRARLIDASAEGDDQTWSFRGSFARFGDGLIHERRIDRNFDGVWMVTDSAKGKASLASSFVHLHPQVEVKETNGSSVLCCLGSQQVLIEAFAEDGGNINVEVVSGGEAPIQGWYFSDFGIAEPSATIRFDYQIGDGKKFGYTINANHISLPILSA